MWSKNSSKLFFSRNFLSLWWIKCWSLAFISSGCSAHPSVLHSKGGMLRWVEDTVESPNIHKWATMLRWRFELEEQWIIGVVSFLVLCISLEKTWRYCKTKIGYRGKEVARLGQLCPTSGGNGFLDPEFVLLPSSWKLSDKIQRAGSGCDLENRYEKDSSIYHL